MPKKPTGVRKRGNTWQYYFDKASIDGKRQTVYRSGFKTQKEAEAARAEAIAAYNNGGFVPLNNDISFSDFAKVFINDLHDNRYSATTIRSYRAALNARLIKKLGGYKLTSINRSIVNQFVNELQTEGLAKKTIQFYLTAGKKLFDVAAQHKITNDNPFKNVSAPDNSLINKGRPHTAYTDDYVNQLFEAYKDDELEPAIMLGYYAGLRISEMCALTWDDINFDTRVITVNKQIVHDELTKTFYFAPPKWNSVRRVKIPIVLCNYLFTLKQQRNGKQHKYKLNPDKSISEGNDFSFVITNWHGKIVCKRYIITRIRNLRQKSYPTFKVHDLRHTHCTKLIDSGVDMKYVQKRLGHKSLKTTLDVYTHLTEERRKTEDEKLDNVFGF